MATCLISTSPTWTRWACPGSELGKALKNKKHLCPFAFQNKIVWGLMPGHHDASNEYTSIDDAINSTLYAKEFGLAGLNL